MFRVKFVKIFFVFAVTNWNSFHMAIVGTYQVCIFFLCFDLQILQDSEPEKLKNNNWFLHHDNAPAHTGLAVWQFLTSKNVTVIPQPPIRLTLLPVTFLYSPRWNYSWKGVVLTWLRRSMQNHKWLMEHTHLRTSRDAWNHGKHAGIAVYMPKGTASEETVESRSYSKELFLLSDSLNFWVAPRIDCKSLC